MHRSTIAKIHRVIGWGMDMDTIDDLAADHIEAQDLRQRLTLRSHAEFLLNNLIRRLEASPQSDLGAHFLPSLALAGAGMAIYLGGGAGPEPGSEPGWPLIPLSVGVLWLFLSACRARGFPTTGAIAPSLVMSFGALCDAWVMTIVLPEDLAIRAGLVLMGISQPALFITLARLLPGRLSWAQMRQALLNSRPLRVIWLVLAAGVACIAAGDLLAVGRHELPNTMQAGAVITGLGLGWMAHAFVAATRRPQAG